MEEVDTALIEHYQNLYEQDPNSRIFATLAEAYRKLNMLQEAKDVAEHGVRKHPDFPSGHVALARVYMALKAFDAAEPELRKATRLAPENILAHHLLAETLLHMRRPKEALKAYKTLLFLSPDNQKARNAVQKLESLTADEYEDEAFAMRPLKDAVKDWDRLELDEPKSQPKMADPEAKRIKNLERILSLADAYIVRNDIDRALKTLGEGEKMLGSDTEIVKRLKLVHQRQLDQIPTPKNAKEIKKIPSREELAQEEKIDYLQDLLSRIKTHAAKNKEQ